MADLIDRKELRDALYEADAVTMQGVKIINQFPSINAVEVVRCGFCKNAEPYDCTINGTAHRLYECNKDKAAIGYNKVVANNDFCSCGERKDGDGNAQK